jgi:hypothetical protein
MTPDSFIPSKGKTCVELPFEVDVDVDVEVDVEVDESKVNEVKSIESLTPFVLFILMITNIQALDVPKTNQTHSITTEILYTQKNTKPGYWLSLYIGDTINGRPTTGKT